MLEDVNEVAEEDEFPEISDADASVGVSSACRDKDVVNAIPKANGKIYALIALLIIIASDYLVFRGGGGYAYGALAILTGGLLTLCNWKGFRSSLLFSVPFLFILAAHSAWQYDSLVATVGVLACFLFSYTLLFEALQAIPFLRDLKYSFNRIFHSTAALLRAVFHRRTQNKDNGGKKLNLWAIIIPLAVCVIFVIIFAKANTIVMGFLDSVVPYITDILKNLPKYLPPLNEWLFWLAMLLICGFILFPCLDPGKEKTKKKKRTRAILPPYDIGVDDEKSDASGEGANSEFGSWGLIWRNTLAAVNLLFVAYLVLEIMYLFGGEELPDGLSYSDYAHRGVFWLTLALALASLFLSFSCSVKHSRSRYYPQIKIFGYCWIGLCFLMGFLAYQRLYIYFCFNGLTEMRILGAIGITLVLAGLVLVALMIRKQSRLYWLVNKQIVAMFLALLIFYVLPRDYLCSVVNVGLAEKATTVEELSPLVIVAHHPVEAESAATLLRLLDYTNPNLSEDDVLQVRQGAAGVLGCLYQKKLETTKSEWRHTDFSRQKAKGIVKARMPEIREIVGKGGCEEAVKRFQKFTRRWW